jgi:hypothetical protein
VAQVLTKDACDEVIAMEMERSGWMDGWMDGFRDIHQFFSSL